MSSSDGAFNSKMLILNQEIICNFEISGVVFTVTKLRSGIKVIVSINGSTCQDITSGMSQNFKILNTLRVAQSFKIFTSERSQNFQVMTSEMGQHFKIFTSEMGQRYVPQEWLKLLRY